VINISLGGEGIGSAMIGAVRRAASAGVVMVMSAGNESLASPSGMALSASAYGGGLVIIAGAVDDTRAIAGFSNQAGSGSGANWYLTALGTRVRTIDQNGTGYLYSGTSFSAPVISGAAALLASAFPNLSGGQIVDLLLKTADDAGAPGTDASYGRGILNIQRAFSPQGATSMAGTGAAVPGSAGEASGAMGSPPGASGAMKGAIILDGYSRAFVIDLVTQLRAAPVEQPLAQSLGGDQRTSTVSAGKMAVSITMDRNRSAQPWVGLAQMGLSHEDGRKARILSGLMLSQLTPRTAVALGLSESGKTLQQRLTGQYQNAFLVARDPMARMGFQGAEASSLGVRHNLGPAGLTVTGERGNVHRPGLASAIRQEQGYTVGSATFDRRIGPATLTLGATRLDERETVLGGRLSPDLFGAGGATSWFADAGASFDMGRGWGAYASYRRGATAMAGGALAQGGSLSTDAWAFDVSKGGAFRPGDRLALRVMQPLRVRSGGYALAVPVSYDYATGGVGYDQRQFSLAPTGREIDLEAAYGTRLWGGQISGNAFMRYQPGHIEALNSDLGAAIRFTLGF
jgi:hypothetical protein